MKIVNNTDLSYREIGLIIDGIMEDSKEDTNYYDKVDILKINYKNKSIKIQIRYLKRYIEWRFDYE